jgi:hypothetical protein
MDANGESTNLREFIETILKNRVFMVSITDPSRKDRSGTHTDRTGAGRSRGTKETIHILSTIEVNNDKKCNAKQFGPFNIFLNIETMVGRTIHL